jgi:hypothetical protein
MYSFLVMYMYMALVILLSPALLSRTSISKKQQEETTNDLYILFFLIAVDLNTIFPPKKLSGVIIHYPLLRALL